ncbi:hypothetical protein N0V90_009999 [Kalmusia sp. IMI 367209]|nr:hypothetical protein N0V90_009999 [Kalmusia sp. IMI 367209]
MEKTMQRLWSQVLHLDHGLIGREDSFFRLGGDSIQAMQLVSRALKENIVLTVGDIFQSATLSAMSEVCAKADNSKVLDIEPFSLMADVGTNLATLKASAAAACDVEMDSIVDVYPYNGLAQVVVDETLTWTVSGNLRGFLTSDQALPMGLGQRLSRCGLVMAEEANYFVWTAHHAIYDGWTVSLLFSTAEQFYHQRSPVPFAPFNQFIHNLQAIKTDASERFWRSEFADANVTHYPPLPSSTFPSRANGIVQHYATVPWTNDSSVTSSILIRAAWALTLMEYSGGDDIAFGLTLSGRTVSIPGIDHMVGPTLNTVPIRICLSDSGMSVGEFLRQLQDQAVAMIAFEQTGLQDIRHLSSGIREAADFQNILVVQGDIESNSTIFNSPVAMGDNETGFYVNPLTIECFIQSDGIKVNAHFDRNLLADEHLGHVLYHFEHVLTQLVTSSTNTSLSHVRSLSRHDDEMIKAWNAKCPETTHDCVHEVIKRQVWCRSGRPAVNGWDASFTYQELNELSDKLASLLNSHGVTPSQDQFVPLCFEKSAWTIVAMLAVLKSGAAFVPIDPTHPTQRRQAIAKQTNAHIILASTKNVELFQGSSDVIVLEVSQSTMDKLPPASADLGFTREVSPSAPAYAIFTSGSTGNPKAVVVEHSALVTSGILHGKLAGINAQSRVLQFAAYTFDVSLSDIFATLMLGGCVCVPSRDDCVNHLASTITSFNVTWACLTPTVVRLLQPEEVPTLEKLIVGGEALTRSIIKDWADRIYLGNIYGPAECTIWCVFFGAMSLNSSPEQIGHGVGAVTWIVHPTDHDRLVPIGCVGELVIEGPVLARGYLNDEAKTNAAFIENAAWAQDFDPGRRKRFYKTGDLARYDPSTGMIQFIGRKDTQIKLRGQRLELGEVEFNLKRFIPQDKNWQVAVDVIKPVERQSHPALTAFICTNSSWFDSNDFHVVSDFEAIQDVTQDVRRALERQLPAYMIPTLFVPVSSIPLTASGKTDRRTLVQLGNDLTSSQLTLASLNERSQREPTTDMEIRLRELWAKILCLEPISISADDTFFQRGGDSILAMRLVAAAREVNIHLLVAHILQKPRLSDMASAAEIRVFENSRVELIDNTTLVMPYDITSSLAETLVHASIAEENVEDLYEATEFQAWAVTSNLLKHRGYMTYFTFKFDTLLDSSRLAAACNAVVERHPILRTVFLAHEQQTLNVVLHSLSYDFIHIESTDSLDTQIDDLIEEDKQRDLSLGQTLTKFMYISGGEDEGSCLILRLSHAQYDGISQPIIYHDLQAAYAGGELSQSPGFSRYIQGTKAAETPDAHSFWMKHLEGSHMTNFFSTPQFVTGNENIRTLSRSVPACSLSQHGITFATVIKTAWSLVLSQLSRENDVVFGQLVSGRNVPVHQAERILGCCVNIIPVRVAMAEITTALDLLQQVQNNYASALSYETTDFTTIVKECTNWPRATRFSSIVQHQNLDDVVESIPFENGATCTISGSSSPTYASDMFIFSIPKESAEVEVSLSFTEGLMTRLFADEVHARLCDVVVGICNDPHVDLASLSAPHTDLPRIPLLARTTEERTYRGLDQPSPVAIVDEAWDAILGQRRLNVTEDTPFFETWVEGILAAQFVDFYKERGFKVNVEDILDAPTKRLQYLLIA